MQRVFSSSYDKNKIHCNDYLMISIIKAYSIAVAKKKKNATKALIAASVNRTRNRSVLYIHSPLCFVTLHSNAKLQKEGESHFVLKFYSKILN